MATNVDVKKLNDAYKRHLDDRFEGAQQKQQNAMAAGVGFAGLGEVGNTIDAIENTFCDAWPKAYKYLNLLLRGVSWFAPAPAAQARAILDAINDEIVPNVCGTTQ